MIPLFGGLLETRRDYRIGGGYARRKPSSDSAFDLAPMSDDLQDTPSRPDAGGLTPTPPEGHFSASRERLETLLAPGTLLADRYRIVTQLGKGGMGEVYRADDLKLDLAVALKFLPAELAADAKRHAQLFEEIKVARRISHPNVCRVYDLGEAEGVYFLSMEYIDGEDLKSLLRRIGRLPWEKSIELGRQICDGLEAAHEAGVLHRDLKPANLMIDGNGRARITDFGLAALAESLLGTKIVAGTPLYMAPEQFSGQPATVKSDLYALGLVLYELFTGRRVFEISSVEEARRLHRRAIPPPPSSLRFGFDPAVEKIILRCLEKDPAKRPESVAEVSAALAAGLGLGLSEGAQVATLLASELVSGSRLIESLGDSTSGALFQRHDRLVRDLAAEHEGREIDKADGFLILFQRPVEALRFALAYHRELDRLAQSRQVDVSARVAIHLGEVVVRRNSSLDVERGAKALEVEGFARPMVTRLMSLAGSRQTLMNQGAFDVARRSARGELDDADSLSWLAHGDYAFEGADEPAAVFEVGEAGFAPLQAPESAGVAIRVATEDTILGWRPAPGLQVPQRRNWIVQRKLGEGGFGETWLVSHAKTGENRVYKFCYEKELLFSLQREITVFRLLKEELGLREDIARILDWNLDEAPYFIELAYVEKGSIEDWAQTRGGIDQVPLAERLEIVSQAATALAAAHSVGVLHKDVKPGNVLVREGKDGAPQAILTDFGIGQITDEQRLAASGITVLGMTQVDVGLESTTSGGTQLYLAPELLAGKAPTIQADIYALGVMLYQMAVGDLARPMPHGWRRQVEDELLREDIADCVDGSPERRPGSAIEVAERLRHLEERRAAVAAEKKRRLDAEKAQRRRRVLAVTAAVSTVFLLVVSLLAIQAVRARADAERRRAQAEGLIDFMLNDLHEGLERIGRLDLLEGVAKSSLAYFESLTARDETPDALFQRGATLENIGDVFLDQGNATAARASQESAIALFEAAVAQEPDADRWREGLGRSRLRLGNVLKAQGETEAALASYRAALEEAQRLAAADAGNSERIFAVAQAHYQIAFLQRQIGNADAVFEEAGKALALLDELTASDAADWRQHLLLLDTHSLLAKTHRFNGSLDKALQETIRAREIAQRMMSEDPGNAFWPRRLAECHFEIGVLLYIRGDLAAALESEEAARTAYRTLTVTDPTRTEWRQWLAASSQIAGAIHAQREQPAEALDLYEESLRILAGLVEEDPKRVRWLEELARSHQIIGELHLSQGETSQADESLSTAVEILQRVVAITGDNPGPRNYLSWTRIVLGDVHARMGEQARARELWTLAVEWLEPITAASDEINYRDTHAQALLRLGRLEESRPLVEDLLARGWKEPDFVALVRRSGLDVEIP